MKQCLLNTLRGMTEHEIYHQLFTDCLTGALNRRAFEQDSRQFVAIVDLDSLKYVNDSLGHRWGDYQLSTLATALMYEFGSDCVYRLSGDEFAVKSEHAVELRQRLVALRSKLPGFSFGLGLGVERADSMLKEDKMRRERNGERAARGECPPWIEGLEETVRVEG